jgi:ribosomal protein L32
MPNLTECKDCGHIVSIRARVCPSCGVDKPGVAPVKTGCGTYLVLSVLVIFSFMFLVNKMDLSDGPSGISRDPHYAVSSIQRAISKSDDYAMYQTEFTTAAQSLLSTGRCQLNELKEIGGFVKAQGDKKNQPIYFTYCGGMTLSNRIYVDVSTGKVFK